MMEFADGRMLAEVAGGIGTITFNNPDKRNAMSLEMWRGLVEILDRFAADAAVRVVVLTGAGPKAFVSGADISQFGSQRADAAAQRDYDALTSAGRARLAAFPRPVIARIRGYCLGGGIGIALRADLRIAAEDAEFGIPAARLGLAYGADMARQLVALVGPAHARMLLYTGARIGAREAERIGLVNRTVRAEDLAETVADLARTIAANAPLSVRAAKLAVDAAETPGRVDEAELEAAIAACFDSADYREGRAAFQEKRPPKFIGA
jgi:enoyl-CoA hydratase/carnithine racemase